MMPAKAPTLSETLVDRIVAQVRDVVRVDKAVLHEPEFGGNEWTYVKECIDTGWVSSVGAYVDRFEAMIADITGARCAIATVNGTAALHVALLLAGVRPDDEVLVPTLTFIATANAVSYAGATPHFVDSEPTTLGVDARSLEDYLTEIARIDGDRCVNRRTGKTIRALMPMHTFGHPVDIDGLLALAERWKLAFVEDAAEALGSSYHGRHCGTFGRVAAFSFNGNKVVTTGGGGAIVTDDPELGRLAKHLTTTARVPHRWSFLHDRIGFNYRLPNINAALGCAQLERLPDLIERKRELARRYISAFSNFHGASILEESRNTSSNYWLVALKLDQDDTGVRDALLDRLNAVGLMARPVWTLMHRLPIYANCPRMPLPQAEMLERQLINLPSSPKLAGS